MAEWIGDYAVTSLALLDGNFPRDPALLRGGTYGLQADDTGCLGICWSNTQPNMPAWGGRDRRIGNNPLIAALPRDGGHVVVGMAMAQFSYG